ncbi:MAG: LLM class flavin-dependent oxidoreductase [Promethearchaeota archaeon]
MVKVKFGIDMSLESYTSKSWERYRDFVKGINEDIWDGLWLGDHLGGIPPSSPFRNYNIWTLFPIFAELLPRMYFGSAVTDPHRYLPQIMAQIVMSIDHISNGRFIYGIGPGEAWNLDTYGIDKSKPISKMEEYIKILRILWQSDGKKVSFEGKFFKFKEAILQPKPIQESIPVWIGANGPRTRKLTGKIADGWLPYSFNTDSYRLEMEEVKTSLRENNRNLEEFTFGYWNWIYINDNEKALDGYTAEKKLTMALQHPYSLKPLGFWKEEKRELYQKLGFEPETLSPLKFHTVDNIDFDIISQIVSDVPDEFIRKSILMGTKEEIITKLEKLIKAGVNNIVLMIDNPLRAKPKPYTWEHVFQLLSEEIIPYLKENY